MDDTAQQVNNQVPPSASPSASDQPSRDGSLGGPAAPPAPSSVPPAPAAPTFHPRAVGGPKEALPLSNRKIEAPASEYMQPTEVAPTIPQEVSEVVELSPDKEQPQLNETHTQVGISHSDPVSIQHPTAPTGSVTLPYTFEQATQIEKATKEDDSEHWLVLLSKYIMRKLAFKG